MKSILLVAQGTSSSNDVIAQAAIETHRRLRHASSSHEAFEILAEDLNDIEVIIVDVDVGDHSLSVLDAISYCETAPPIVVVTGGEDSEIRPMAHCHGAVACISKPFTARELAALIEDVRTPEYQRTGGSSDRWGHPIPRTRRLRIGHTYDRMHAMKL